MVSASAAAKEDPKHRRRGVTLEAALLDAAWAELEQPGFAKLTMESVAERARTSVAVLYRRWPNKNELALAAIRHYGQSHPIELPDTGELRGDLIELLERFSAGRAELVAVVGAVFSGLLVSAGLSPEQVRREVLGQSPRLSDELFRRAAQRGELELDLVPAAVLELPFQLVRHDILMSLQPISAERIRSIVDELFLPLVVGRHAGGSTPPPPRSPPPNRATLHDSGH